MSPDPKRAIGFIGFPLSWWTVIAQHYSLVPKPHIILALLKGFNYFWTPNPYWSQLIFRCLFHFQQPFIDLLLASSSTWDIFHHLQKRFTLLSGRPRTGRHHPRRPDFSEEGRLSRIHPGTPLLTQIDHQHSIRRSTVTSCTVYQPM